jgi:hypothetical protein
MTTDSLIYARRWKTLAVLAVSLAIIGLVKRRLPNDVVPEAGRSRTDGSELPEAAAA